MLVQQQKLKAPLTNLDLGPCSLSNLNVHFKFLNAAVV